MNFPSVKRIRKELHDFGLKHGDATRIRRAMQSKNWDVLNELTTGFGVEYIPRGHNSKSPSIEYINQGDTYATTIMLVDGRNWRIGCWGDYVERGNYD